MDDYGEKLQTHPSYREHGELKGPKWVPIGEGITGQVALIGEAMRVDDVRNEQNYIEVDSTTRSEICVPLKIGERVIGVLNAERELVGGFTDSDERLLATIAGQLATAIDRLRAESAVHRRAGQLSHTFQHQPGGRSQFNTRSSLCCHPTGLQHNYCMLMYS